MKMCNASFMVFPIISENLVRNSFSAPSCSGVLPAFELSSVSFSSSVVISLSASSFSRSVSLLARTSGCVLRSPKKVFIFLLSFLGLYLKISSKNSAISSFSSSLFPYLSHVLLYLPALVYCCQIVGIFFLFSSDSYFVSLDSFCQMSDLRTI